MLLLISTAGTYSLAGACAGGLGGAGASHAVRVDDKTEHGLSTEKIEV